jgi:hypothetical protein
MRLTEEYYVRRIRLAALGTGLVVALLGAIFLALLPGSSGAAVSVAPTNLGEPRITGTPRAGQQQRTTRGTWAGTPPFEYAYRWYRCDGRGAPDASDCARIANAANATYTARLADAGFRLRSQVTASNADGSATATSNPTEVIQSARPANTSEPTISGTPNVGNRLTANRGGWVGSQPITYAFRWLRCNTSGGNCSEISGATDNEYVVVANDLGRTLRVRVTATNDDGPRSALSNPTGVVQQTGGTPPPPPSGSSVHVSSVPKGERLIVSQVRFSPNPVTNRQSPINVSIRVIDTRGLVVRGALVFIRSVPRRTTGGNLQQTGADGWLTYSLQPLQHFPAVNGNVQFFVKTYRAGDPPLAGIAGYRLVQVRVLTAGER